MKATKSGKKFIRVYCERFLIVAIFFNSSICVGAEDRVATTPAQAGADQAFALFDADKFALSGCNSTLLKDMKKRNVAPKRTKFGTEAAYEYRSANAVITVPRNPNQEVARDDNRISLWFSTVTNLNAYDFTRPFHGKALSEVERFFKAKYEGSQRVGYTVDPNKKSITLDTEALDMEFHSNKDGIVYHIDFNCGAHD